jgi:stringent starvation protein B
LKPKIVFHVVAVVVLAAVVAAAQSPEPKQKRTQTSDAQSEKASGVPASKAAALSARESGSGMATGRKSGSVIAADRESVTTARETGSGMATGKRVSGDPHEYLEPHTSAHEAVSLDGGSKDAGKMSEAQSNPLYKDGGSKGSNPLYEGKDRTAPPPSGTGLKPADYKDGEDGTTHTRPANPKPAV